MPIRSQHEPSIHDVFRAVLRHRKKALYFFSFVVFCTVVLVLILPSTYLSTSKLLVLVGRETVSLDPVVGTGKTIAISTSRETEINTLLEMLKSQPILSKVVDQVGADVILDPPEHEGVYRTTKRLLKEAKNGLKSGIKRLTFTSAESSGGGNPEMIVQEEAIKVLNDAISVSAPKNTTVVRVEAKAHSPALAQTLASALVDVYRQEHVKLYSTAGSEDFFRSQKQVIGDQLAEKRAELSELRSEMGIGTAEAEYKRLEEEKARVTSLRNTLTQDLVGTLASIKALETAILTAENVVETGRSEGMTNVATDGMRQQLFDLEIAEAQASRMYTEDHPVLKRTRAQLAALREIFAAEDIERTVTTFGRNPSLDALGLQLEQQLARSSEVRAQLDETKNQQESLIASLQKLNTNSGTLDQLTQDIAFLEVSYNTYSDSLEQSRIGSSLAQQQIGNVNVVQPATFVREPVSPKRMQIAGVGLFLAIVGSVAVALFLEYLDNRLKSPAEVEALTELPVLLALPREPRPLQIPELAKGSQE